MVLVGGSVALFIGAIGGPAMVLVAGLGAVLAGLGVWIWLRTRSLRLVVEADYLHLTGNRRYHLARGDLKRVAAEGVSGVGLRDGDLPCWVSVPPPSAEERIEVIRLGATPSFWFPPSSGASRWRRPRRLRARLVEALLDAARTRAERPAPQPTPRSARRPPRAAMPLTAAAADAPGPLATRAPLPVPEPTPQPRP